jgi:hypothetical protein
MTTSDDDIFQLEPRQVGRGRRPWPGVIAVGAAGVSIVLAAVLTGDPSDRSTALSPTAASVASPSAPALGIATDGADGGRPGASAETSRPMPTSITCHDIDRSACRLAVATALGTLEGGDAPEVESADVWPGIVCGDTLDCPATRLDGRATPLADVIFRLVGGGPAAWINVVYRSPSRPLQHEPTLDAWIARWQAAP